MTLEKLHERVQAMTDGERKRRETALKFIAAVEDTLYPVARDLWGNGEHADFDDIAWLKIKENGDTTDSTYYFSYGDKVGFYLSHDFIPFNGTPIENLRGSEFWVGIRRIIFFIEYVSGLIDSKSSTRQRLLSLLKTEGGATNE